jgi:hypothetical protein
MGLGWDINRTMYSNFFYLLTKCKVAHSIKPLYYHFFDHWPLLLFEKSAENREIKYLWWFRAYPKTPF